jgi:hypothetical protein
MLIPFFLISSLSINLIVYVFVCCAFIKIVILISESQPTVDLPRLSQSRDSRELTQTHVSSREFLFFLIFSNFFSKIYFCLKLLLIDFFLSNYETKRLGLSHESFILFLLFKKK